MRPHPCVVVCALLALAALPTSAADAPSFTIRLLAQGAEVVSTGDAVRLASHDESGHRFTVDLAEGARGTIDARALNVTGRHDVAVWLGDRFVQEVSREGLATAPAPSLNVTSADGAMLDLTLPPGKSTLLVQIDHTPPVAELVDVTSIGHVSALVRTRTDEPTLAALTLTSKARVVPFSTPQPAYEQSFPLSGLDPDTDYSFEVVFEDYSGNRAHLGPYAFRTTPAPIRPTPTIRLIEPADGARLSEPVARILASVEDANASILTLTLFVDKVPAVPPVRLVDGYVDHRLADPLGVGTHTITLEAGNALGGMATLRAKVTVLAHRAVPEVLPMVLAAGLCGAALAARRIGRAR